MAASRPLGRSDVRALLAAHDIVPKRSRGQNFLVDPNMAERITRLAEVGPDDLVVEIGTGLGALTAALAATGAAVTTIEIDDRLVALVETRLAPGVRVIHADAMRCDWESVLATPLRPTAAWTLVANLPYNVATPIILELLIGVPRITRMVVMVQAEVGARLVAPAGGEHYGAPSVRVAYFARAHTVLRVPPEVFYPRPNVDSVVVEITRRQDPAVPTEVASYAEVDELVRAAFAGRRKMLRRSLRELVGPDVFAASGISPQERAEQLDIAAWGKLAACRRTFTSARAPS